MKKFNLVRSVLGACLACAAMLFVACGDDNKDNQQVEHIKHMGNYCVVQDCSDGYLCAKCTDPNGGTYMIDYLDHQVVCSECKSCDSQCATCDQCKAPAFSCSTCTNCDGQCATCDQCKTPAFSCSTCTNCDGQCATCDQCKTPAFSCSTCTNCDGQCATCDQCKAPAFSCSTCTNCDGQCATCDQCKKPAFSCSTCTNCDGQCATCDLCKTEFTSCSACTNCLGKCAGCDTCRTGQEIVIRLMTANITSGNHQSYLDPGIHVFQAMKPDIVMIQEFSYEGGTREDLVKLAFGEGYYYSFSPEDAAAYSANIIPNGIVSRYPIIDHGFWPAEGGASNRNWDWALIDIPGERDLFAVSVHLTIDGTAKERPKLLKKIQEYVGDHDYYLVLGGDFNTKKRGGAENDFKPLFQNKKNGAYPVDQNGNNLTSGQRDDPYDWLLFSYDFDKLEIPVFIGDHEYPDGHVFDACVYYDLDELDDVAPVMASDCGDEFDNDGNLKRVMNMQHMAVIRDVMIKE